MKSFTCPKCKKTFPQKDLKKLVGYRKRKVGNKIVSRIQSRCIHCRGLPSKKKRTKQTRRKGRRSKVTR